MTPPDRQTTSLFRFTARPPAHGLIRLAWAGVLLGAPAAILDTVGGPVDRTSLTVARLLGARHAIQGLIEITSWPKWRRAGSYVDAAHSLTAAGLGASAPRWRRVGFTDSAIAAAFAVTGWG